MPSKADILQALRKGEVELPPLTIELDGVEPEGNGGSPGPDAYVDVRWGDRVFGFVAEIRAQASPKSFRAAVAQVREWAEAKERRPLVVSTYLSPERLEELESKGVSGLDLCGNGVVLVPGELLVVRKGNPNLYPAGRRVRRVYRGVSSLVARVFVLCPRYESVQAVQDEITDRGGRVSLSTVSKVLKSLEEDLVIRRDGRASSLLQADELLDRLASSYKPPAVRERKKYRWRGVEGELSGRLAGWNRDLVLTGAASVDTYGVMPRDKTVQCYCTSIEPIERKLRGELEEAPRFPDLELVETRDPNVYFDSRNGGNISAASPVQCWLELQAGDKRQQDAAVTVRQRILDELRKGGWPSP